MWQRYWDFYVGGEQLRRNGSQYLVRRQKEPNDVVFVERRLAKGLLRELPQRLVHRLVLGVTLFRETAGHFD